MSNPEDGLLAGDVRKELEVAGIHIINHEDLKSRHQRKVRDYFEREIFPVLTPCFLIPGIRFRTFQI